MEDLKTLEVNRDVIETYSIKDCEYRLECIDEEEFELKHLLSISPNHSSSYKEYQDDYLLLQEEKRLIKKQLNKQERLWRENRRS